MKLIIPDSTTTLLVKAGEEIQPIYFENASANSINQAGKDSIRRCGLKVKDNDKNGFSIYGKIPENNKINRLLCEFKINEVDIKIVFTIDKEINTKKEKLSRHRIRYYIYAVFLFIFYLIAIYIPPCSKLIHRQYAYWGLFSNYFSNFSRSWYFWR